MGNVTYERLDAMVTPKIYPQISITPVLEHEGDFVRLHHIDMEWPVGEGVEKYVPIRYVSKHVARVLDLETENDKLRELCRDMYGYASHREMELCNACTMADGDYADCAACDEYDGACGIAKKRFEELYRDRMSTLGIEVE